MVTYMSWMPLLIYWKKRERERIEWVRQLYLITWWVTLAYINVKRSVRLRYGSWKEWLSDFTCPQLNNYLLLLGLIWLQSWDWRFTGLCTKHFHSGWRLMIRKSLLTDWGGFETSYNSSSIESESVRSEVMKMCPALMNWYHHLD